jgi:hypothetical protein
MKILYREEKLARELINLTVALVDINPMMDPFRALITHNKEGIKGLVVEKYGVADLFSGMPIATALVIHTGTYKKDQVPTIKSLFKNNLKAELQKYGYLDGLSEERVK